MKNLIWLKKTVLVLLLVSFTVACSDDDEVSAQGTTITDLAIDSPALSSLVAALTAAEGDLPAVLKGAGPYTVLAPTNAAFEEFLDGRDLEDIPSGELTQVLLNHVLNGRIEAADLASLNADGIFYASTLATGAKANTQMSIYFNTEIGVEFNGVASVIPDGANIQASNGVIHIVDAVIDLPTIVTFATADDRFSTLVSALTADDSFGYVAALGTPNGTEPTPFTVFAPTNDAFAALLVDLEATGLISIPIPTLQTVLEYHVVTEANVLSSELPGLDGASVETFGGSNITIQASPAGIIGPGDDTTLNPIVIADVQASNGVIHALSRVIR